ncbi:MAG: oligosaccharide flippase family protein [Bacteroidaceae bacterium]|nr:oligosaccharide flippase family protein [Bacteroidaceae bacterium]
MSKAEKLHTRETEDTSYRHVLKYTGIFGSVQGLKMMVSIVRNKLTVYLLGAPALGLISVYNTISEFVASCTNFGLPLNATREASELFEDNASPMRISHFACIVRTWALWTSLLSVLFCAVLSPLLSYGFFEHDWHHWPEVIYLVPIIVSLIISGAECSLLKGLRQLRRVAKIETLAAIATLLLTIPFYLMFQMRGIILGLVASSVAVCAIHLYYSVGVVTYRVMPLSRRIYREGWPMIRRGIPYVLAGIVNSGVAMLIPMLILHISSMADVGYYRAGYYLIVAYSGLIFVALESDYYPRLSAVNHDIKKVNQAVNQQIDVTLRLISPFLILFIICMPWIVPVLYESDFSVILGMTICAVYYMFFRSIMLPVSYTTLARGDSVLFLCLEVVSGIMQLLLMWHFYSRYGLEGAGVAFSVSSFADMAVSYLTCRLRYGLRLSRKTWINAAYFCCCLSLTVAAWMLTGIWTRYAVALVALLLSGSYALGGLIRRIRT